MEARAQAARGVTVSGGMPPTWHERGLTATIARAEDELEMHLAAPIHIDLGILIVVVVSKYLDLPVGREGLTLVVHEN